MDALHISRDKFEALVRARKMTPQEFSDLVDSTGDVIHFESFDALRDVADRLNVAIDRLFDDADLDDGIKVCRGLTGYQRTEEREGCPYYTYTHLANSKTVPNLMSLHLTLRCNDPRRVVLNAGHQSHEFVYVLRGTVGMHWRSPKESRETTLQAGDSVYLQPSVPHSFIARESHDAEILAVNF